jgi:hypothetical protein
MNSGDEISVAVMQPYFFPYAGYFRLLDYCDKFVVFDCAQYTRRSWITRNVFSKVSGEPDWLNMPIAKCPQSSLIKEIQFRDEDQFNLEPFTLLKKLATEERIYLFDTSLTPVDLLCRQLTWVNEKLDISCEILRSSSFSIDSDIRGQDRVIRIAKMAGGKEYVNLAGGRDLYSESTFDSAGLELKILTQYQGSTTNILDRILNENLISIKTEISEQTNFQNPLYCD